MNAGSKTSKLARAIPMTRRTAVGGAAGAAAMTALIHRPASGHAAIQATPAPEAEAPSMRLIYSFLAQFTGIVPIGVTPRGVRLDLPYKGEVVEGPLTGAAVDGIDYILLRGDGVGVMDVRGVVTTQEGHAVSVSAGGYVFMPEGVQLPPPDVLLAPDFVWPDMEATLHGYATFETGAADLAWFNSAALVVGGHANLGKGELFATAHTLYDIPGLSLG